MLCSRRLGWIEAVDAWIRLSAGGKIMNFQEILDRLPKGRLPDKGLTDVEVGSAIIKYAEEIAVIAEQKSEAYDEDADENYELLRIARQLRSFRWSFPIKFKKIKPEKCDRTKSLISGPLFTSENYPWPMSDGRYREPVVQFHLSEIADLTHEDFGEGLFQLWVGPDAEGYEVRVIPTCEVEKGNLLPPPAEISDTYFEESEFYAGFGAWPEPDQSVYQITGIKDRVLSWDAMLNMCNDDFEFEEKFGSEFNSLIAKFIAILPDRLPSTEPHFFGNFNLIQYAPSESNPTLIAFEGKPCFLWGDCGNAQVYYVKGSVIEYIFQWSCG